MVLTEQALANQQAGCQEMQATIAQLSGELSDAKGAVKQLATDLEGAKQGHTSLTVASNAQHAEDGATSADPSHPPAATPDLCEAKAASADESGDTGAAASAADAVLDSTGSTAVPAAGCRSLQDRAGGNSRSSQAATAYESGGAGAAAADAALDSTGSTAVPGASNECHQDSAEGNSRSIRDPTA
ncbi:hypothetical protein ABBQ32_012973 [Trebouxia sp. C0010 RCD-2024]